MSLNIGFLSEPKTNLEILYSGTYTVQDVEIPTAKLWCAK